ncbi:HEAT repeat protein [Streptomyces sp. SPB162]|nr:HEAT repeat protein [Streptomyces sp. SPB162]
MLPGDESLRTPLVDALGVDDPRARAAALYVLRALRLGDAVLFGGTLDDADIEVRIETVRALLSVDAVDVLARAAADPSREVRVAVAKGLGTVDGGLPTLKGLIQDGDVLVRAAALEALAGAGCPPPLDSAAAAALDDPAWQVRRGAAAALGAADPVLALPALLAAVRDPHADVRKAVVLALLPHGGGPGPVREALAAAADDTDADVRAYARRALEPAAG